MGYVVTCTRLQAEKSEDCGDDSPTDDNDDDGGDDNDDDKDNKRRSIPLLLLLVKRLSKGLKKDLSLLAVVVVMARNHLRVTTPKKSAAVPLPRAILSNLLPTPLQKY